MATALFIKRSDIWSVKSIIFHCVGSGLCPVVTFWQIISNLVPKKPFGTLSMSGQTVVVVVETLFVVVVVVRLWVVVVVIMLFVVVVVVAGLKPGCTKHLNSAPNLIPTFLLVSGLQILLLPSILE